MNNIIWVNHTADLPNPQNILNVIDEKNQEWIALSSFIDWDEPIKKGYDKYAIIHKGLWYQFKLFNSKKDLNDFQLWAYEQWFWNDWMPRTEGHYQVYSREHYWSTAYNFFNSHTMEVMKNGQKSNLNMVHIKKYAHKIALTTDKYYWEDDFDYSKEDSFNILKPSKYLMD